MKIIIITDNSELIIHVQNNSNNDNNDHDHNDNITNDNVQNKKKKNDDSKERHGKIYTITYIAKKKKSNQNAAQTSRTLPRNQSSSTCL